MLKRWREKGKAVEFRNGEDVMRWWIGENPKQVRFEELINDERN